MAAIATSDGKLTGSVPAKLQRGKECVCLLIAGFRQAHPGVLNTGRGNSEIVLTFNTLDMFENPNTSWKVEVVTFRGQKACPRSEEEVEKSTIVYVHCNNENSRRLNEGTKEVRSEQLPDKPASGGTSNPTYISHSLVPTSPRDERVFRVRQNKLLISMIAREVDETHP